MNRLKSECSDTELLEALRIKAKSLGRTPLMVEVDADRTMLSSKGYCHRFGTWSKAIAKAGLSVRLPHKVRLEREVLIHFLCKKSEELGYTPNSSEFDLFDDVPSYDSYLRVFKGWDNAVRAARLPPPKKRIIESDGCFKSPYESLSNDDLAEMLKRKASELGHTPSCKEVNSDSRLPHAMVFARRFGGKWSNALLYAGLQPRKGALKSINPIVQSKAPG